MRTYNIYIKENADDNFIGVQNVEEVYLQFLLGCQTDLVSTNISTLLRQKTIFIPEYCQNLLDFAITVYSTDQIISRKEQGYQGWSRHIRIYFPVADLSRWNGIRDAIEKMLTFLSGDKWEIVFRQSTVTGNGSTFTRAQSTITKVSLLSGGLDSLVGAIDLLENGEKVAFVSHYKRGSEGSRQIKIYAALAAKYQGNVHDHRFYVQPNQKHSMAVKEDTSRSRSFLFIALGLVMAHAFGDHVELIVPENGLISLNVPLTPTRLSSHSTRTTHPHYFELFRQVASAIGISNSIVNPYRFMTKGEMMAVCKNTTLLRQLCPDTLSCSHPDTSRYIKGSSPGLNCGYCVPCIIRQAAEKAAGVSGSKATNYAVQIKYNPPAPISKKGRDLRAFKMALEELKTLATHSKVLRILKAGPLPFADQAELDKYLDVYNKGMEEVRNFLR